MPANRRMFWKVRATRACGRPEVGHALEQEERAVAPNWSAGAVGERSSRSSAAIAVAQRDAAFGRLVEAGDAVEDGGLAGAVRADQGGDVALAAEGEIVDGDEAAEAHGQMLDAQERVGDPPSAVALPDEVGGDGLAAP